MRTKIPVTESFVIDTYKVVDEGKFYTGVLIFKGKKKIDSIQWKEHSFATQEEADEFARAHCLKMGLSEAVNEGDVRA
jgi:hypothetical protein